MDHYQSHLFKSITIALGISWAPVVQAMDFRQWNYIPQVSIGFPEPLQVGVEALSSQSLRLFSNMGYVYLPFGNYSRSLQLFNLEAGMRYFPWRNPLLLSFSFGYFAATAGANISSYKIDDQQIATGAYLRFSNLYIAPTAGCNLHVSQKLFLGFDMGFQIPIFASGKMELENTNGTSSSDGIDLLKVNSDDAMSRIAALVLPRVVFRLGWVLD